jgi:hypothetical protein
MVYPINPRALTAARVRFRTSGARLALPQEAGPGGEESPGPADTGCGVPALFGSGSALAPLRAG